MVRKINSTLIDKAIAQFTIFWQSSL